MDYKESKKFLKDGKEWCEEKSVYWAEIRSFKLSELTITFCLGILAFDAVMSSLFSIRYMLIAAVGVAILSILLSFIYIWKVCVENINHLQAKTHALDEALSNLTPENIKEAECKYDAKMGRIEGELRGKESCWDVVQQISFITFFASLIISIIGFVI